MADTEWFLARVVTEPNSGCWLWAGAVTPQGYGNILRRGRYLKAHRFSYEVHQGPITDGLCVLHRCDTPSCVNPLHLRLGSKRDNTQDMLLKGRHRGPRKLTDEQVDEIRASSETNVRLAERFGVGDSMVCLIRSGRKRKHRRRASNWQ